jgi:urease accessory protein
LLRLHGIVGLADDPVFRAKLHELEHRNGIEVLYVPPSDSGRKRFRLETDRGTDCGISVGRGEELSDGTILYLDEERAIIVRFGDQAVWRLRPVSKSAALKLGWHAGNLHWRVRFDGECLLILLDAPLADYRARVSALLLDGEVQEVADA